MRTLLLACLLPASGGLFGQNVTSLSAQIQRTPTAALFVERGGLYLEAGDAKQAIADFDRALEREPVNSRALTLRAKAYARQGNQQNAITDLSGAIALAPGDAELYLARGDAYAAAGDTRRAAEDREEALRLSPEAYTAWTESAATAPVVVAVVAPRKPEPAKAPAVSPAVTSAKSAPLAPVEDVPAADPASSEPADVHFRNGRDLVYKGRFKEGLAELNEALRLQPQNRIYYNTRGFGYYLSKDYKRAIADFNEALRLDPNYLNALHNLALAHKNSGDQAGYDAARQRELALGKKLGVAVK